MAVNKSFITLAPGVFVRGNGILFFVGNSFQDLKCFKRENTLAYFVGA